MPGPGPHLIYSLAISLSLFHSSRASFSPAHALVFSLNSFLGPDLGSLLHFLLLPRIPWLASILMAVVHHPLGYFLTLGPPLTLFYSLLSKWWLAKAPFRLAAAEDVWEGRQDADVATLSPLACAQLILAGSLSHFFLDNLFEEGGHTATFDWVISTGFWKPDPPLFADSIFVIFLLSAPLPFVIFYILSSRKRAPATSALHALLFMSVIAALYAAWCASNLYLLPTPRPPVGEEADLGVIVFLSVFFFLPLLLLVLSSSSMSRTGGARHANVGVVVEK